MMNNSHRGIEIPFQANPIVKTQTIYSIKKNAWLLLGALKNITPYPTFKTLVDVSTNTVPAYGNSLQRHLFCIYPHLSVYINYEALVSSFITAIKIDLDTKLKYSNILQFLSFCDGYPAWENMQHHLSAANKNIATFSFRLTQDNDTTLDVYCFFDDDKHPFHGEKLNKHTLRFPEQDPRRIWGIITKSDFKKLIQNILCFMNKTLNNNKVALDGLADVLYFYFKDVEQFYSELLITELDIRQLVEFEVRASC